MVTLFVWFTGSKTNGAGESKAPTVVPTAKSTDTAANVQIANHEMVQIRFSWEADGIKYNDALNILKSEYDKMTPAQIEQMKQERFNNWVKTVNGQSGKN